MSIEAILNPTLRADFAGTASNDNPLPPQPKSQAPATASPGLLGYTLRGRSDRPLGTPIASVPRINALVSAWGRQIAPLVPRALREPAQQTVGAPPLAMRAVPQLFPPGARVINPGGAPLPSSAAPDAGRLQAIRTTLTEDRLSAFETLQNDGQRLVARSLVALAVDAFMLGELSVEEFDQAVAHSLIEARMYEAPPPQAEAPPTATDPPGEAARPDQSLTEPPVADLPMPPRPPEQGRTLFEAYRPLRLPEPQLPPKPAPGQPITQIAAFVEGPRGQQVLNLASQDLRNVPDLPRQIAQLRNNHKRIQLDLRGADLSGAQLAGVDLVGARLEGAKLNGAHLQQANLQAANLSGAELNQADLRGANLRATFDRASMRGANLGEAGLNEASLLGTDLSKANLAGASLFEADAARANFAGADLREAYLYGAQLNHATLNGAQLQRAILYRADLGGAHASGADLSGANLNSAVLDGANFTGANLGQASLRNASLQRTNLQNANLDGATLRGADLGGANVSGVDFSRTDTRGWLGP